MFIHALKAIDGLAAGAAITVTTNGSGVDLSTYGNPGRRDIMAVLSAGAVVATGTYNVKVQESSDNVTFTDITGAAFAQFTGNIGATTLFFNTMKRYVRIVATLGGTSPSAVVEVALLVEQRTP